MSANRFSFLLVFGLLPTMVAAQVPSKIITVWSNSTCGSGPDSLLGEKSQELSLYGHQGTDTEFMTMCAHTNLVLPGWETDKGEETVIYVQSGDIGESCKLIFYTEPLADEDIKTKPCTFWWRTVGHDKGCTRVNIPTKFSYT
jgi:hypothetical protein